MDRAVRDRLQSVGRAGQSCLAGATFPDQRKGLAGPDLETDAGDSLNILTPQHRANTERHFKIAYLEDGVHVASTSWQRASWNSDMRRLDGAVPQMSPASVHLDAKMHPAGRFRRSGRSPGMVGRFRVR